MDEQDIEKAILRKVYLWLVAGGVTLGGVAGVGGFRPDPFSGTDAKLMEREIMLEVSKNYNECQLQINQVEARKMPGLTRRIQALEDSVRRTDPEYQQPSLEWY